MPYPDKYHMSRKEAHFFARKNLVYTTSKFEGTHVTLPQTRTIIEGMAVSGISTDEIATIVNLKRGWQFVIANEEPYSLKISNQINAIVAKEDSLAPGHIRTGNVMLDDTTYIPEIHDKKQVPVIIQNILNQDKSWTTRLLELLLQMMRAQFYWDGNKRAAFLTVNYLTINAGIGLINVNETQLEAFSQLLSDFYESNQPKTLMDWLYANCIHGLTFKH